MGERRNAALGALTGVSGRGVRLYQLRRWAVWSRKHTLALCISLQPGGRQAGSWGSTSVSVGTRVSCTRVLSSHRRRWELTAEHTLAWGGGLRGRHSAQRSDQGFSCMYLAGRVMVNASEAASPLREKCSLVPQTALTRGSLICSLGMLCVALSLRPLSLFFCRFCINCLPVMPLHILYLS